MTPVRGLRPLPDLAIEPARPEDLPAILALLERAGLPRAGIKGHLGTAVVARSGAQLVGCAAVELYDSAALLRSVAVDADQRGHGLGHRLTDAALAVARARGARTAYLLTETAAAFFPRFGFAPIARDQVPAAVRGSIEFTSACPATAQAMMAGL
jgi:amino-acid N-acetyltransferase